MSLYTFLANIDDAERTEESADDITAADTAPRPKKETNLKNNRNVVEALTLNM